MAKRTDIHRPSLDGFDPQDYELFGVYHLVTKTKKLDGIIFVPGVPYGRWEEQWTVVTSRFKIDTDALENNGWSSDVITNADGKERDSVHAHQCAHCGQHLRYGALLTNESEMSLIVVGEDCLGNRFRNVTAAQFKQLREDAKAKAAATRSLDRKNTAIKDNPRLSEAYESDNTFVQDVMRRFDRKGEITKRQIEAVIKVLDRDAQRAEQRKQWQAEAADAADAPTGKVTVTGEIISTKWQESGFHSVHKMIVKTEEGWKLWVTVPSSVYDPSDSSLPITGKRVTLTANVTPSDRDPKFAFGKRPTNAAVIS
jgi:hypothetical protein